MNNGVIQSIFPIWKKSFTRKEDNGVNREEQEFRLTKDSPK